MLYMIDDRSQNVYKKGAIRLHGQQQLFPFVDWARTVLVKRFGGSLFLTVLPTQTKGGKPTFETQQTPLWADDGGVQHA